jgi:glycosyltransferase involved in cell wall biosynthesis
MFVARAGCASGTRVCALCAVPGDDLFGVCIDINTRRSHATTSDARAMNALMVSNYPSDTGYAWWLMEHFWRILGDMVADRGGRAYVAYPRIAGLSERIRNSALEPIELTLPWATYQQRADARRFIRERKIDLVYFTDRPYATRQYAHLRRYGVRHIIVHDHTPGDRPPMTGARGALKALRNRMPWFCADRVLTVCELMRQRSLLNGRIPAHKCFAVQNGIAPVRPNPAASRRLRAELGIPDQAIVVVTSGRAHPYKRFDFVIDVAHRACPMAPDLELHFVLAGDGPSMVELEQQVTRLRLQRRVHLLGFRRDVHDVLGAANIALHAALGEAFSLAIVEYMSAGLPVLVPDIPSVRQAVTDGVSGFVFPSTDPDAAAKAVVALARDRALRRSMGCAARHRANTEFSLERCTAEFRAATEDLVSA